jgi:hypothetical protein
MAATVPMPSASGVKRWRSDWMSKDEMAQAVPPAYAEFIGRAALAQLRV